MSDLTLPWKKDKDQLDRMERSLQDLNRKVDHLMALVDDLRAAQGSMAATLDVISTGVSNLNTEVQDLIARLQPGATITAEDVAAAQALGAKSQAIADAIAAIPPEPAA